MSEEKTWIDEMIERESTVLALRTETTSEFCQKRGVAESTYYFQKNKKENKAKVLEICLNLAKKYTPDVMENLGVRAMSNTRDAELFLDYVLGLSKNVDVKSDGKPIIQIASEVATKYALDSKPSNDS